MGGQVNPQRLYRFESFEVDVAAGRLRKHGQRLRLAGQPLDILVMLMERTGEVVSREEIHQKLWSGETFVDFENGLNKAVSKLRVALSDSADQPEFIETLPRKGYRFLVPVQRIDPVPTNSGITSKSDASEVPALPLAEVPARRNFSRKLALAILTGALACVAFWVALRTRPIPKVVKAAPLTSNSRADVFGGLTTDGVRLFFLERRGHHWQLAQMPASGGPAQPFPTPFANAKILSISPDAAEFLLAPFDSREMPVTLWTMPSVGGAPRRVGQVVATDATYTPDGTKIMFATDDGIFEIGRDGMNTHKLADASGSKSSLSWSPDGKMLRFNWLPPHQSVTRIWSMNADGSNLRELHPGWKPNTAECCGKWTHDGRYFVYLAFESSRGGSLWISPGTGGNPFLRQAPVYLDLGPLPVSSATPGLDGRHIFVLGNNSHEEIARFDIPTQSFRTLIAGQSGSWPVFSHEGQWMIYRGPGGALWCSKLDGSDARELVSGNLQPTLPALSSDSRIVAFTAVPKGATASRIYVVPFDGGEPRELVQANFPVDAPSWSPDGQSLAYSGDAPDAAQSGLYLLDWKTRETHKIPGSEGYWKSAWAPDGNSLATVSMDDKSIAIFERSSQKWTVVVHGNVFGPVAWSKDGHFIYYQDLLEEDEPVRRYNVKTGAIDRVMDCHSLLEGGVQRCGFESLMADDSVVLSLTRGDHDVYSLEVELP